MTEAWAGESTEPAQTALAQGISDAVQNSESFFVVLSNAPWWVWLILAISVFIGLGTLFILFLGLSPVGKWATTLFNWWGRLYKSVTEKTKKT